MTLPMPPGLEATWAPPKSAATNKNGNNEKVKPIAVQNRFNALANAPRQRFKNKKRKHNDKETDSSYGSGEDTFDNIENAVQKDELEHTKSAVSERERTANTNILKKEVDEAVTTLSMGVKEMAG